MRLGDADDMVDIDLLTPICPRHLAPVFEGPSSCLQGVKNTQGQFVPSEDSMMNPTHDAAALPTPAFATQDTSLPEGRIGAVLQGEQGLAEQISGLIQRLLEVRDTSLRAQQAATLARTSLGIRDGRGGSRTLGALAELETLTKASCDTALQALGLAMECGETLEGQIQLSAQAAAEWQRKGSDGQ